MMSTVTSRPSPLARIAAVRRSGLLERAGHEHFDHLVEHVRLVLDVPVAIVSIVDEHRQVFAGHAGLPEPWASLGQTPITHSFCQHVVDQARPLSVSDALAEPLVRDNLAIGDLGVVAYLGVPIHLPTGELVGALAAIDSRPRSWTEHDLAVLRSVATIVDKQIRVGVSELKYRTLIDDMAEGFYMVEAVRDADGQVIDARFVEVNPAFGRLTGVAATHALGMSLSDVAPGSFGDLMPVIRGVLNGQGPAVHVGRSTLVAGRWFETRVSALDGERAVGFFADVTERRREDELRDLLNGEMSHRLKNTLMMVQALTTQTLRPVAERELVEALGTRIQALSSAHDILLQRQWQEAGMADVCTATFARLCVQNQVALDGPEVALGPPATLSLSLLLHELTTNAIKYGALSSPTGQVRLSWRVDAESVRMRWIEQGGPPVVPPAAKGFGSRLIGMGLGAGKAETFFDPDGLRLELVAPLARLSET